MPSKTLDKAKQEEAVTVITHTYRKSVCLVMQREKQLGHNFLVELIISLDFDPRVHPGVSQEPV